MRQFLDWRFWLSVTVPVLLAAALWWVVTDGDGSGTAVGAGAVAADAAGAAIGLVPALPGADREIHLIAPVLAARSDAGFGIVEGVTIGRLELELDATRVARIPPGTPGENRCATLDRSGTCAVALSVFGESVTWFAIVPLTAPDAVELPAVRELVEGRRVRLANGWIVRRALRIERSCATETESLTDFVERFGDAATSTFALDAQVIERVACPG